MAQEKRPEPVIKAPFDAYGTLFDVHSVISTCNELGFTPDVTVHRLTDLANILQH